jgi:hypothetical protein
VAPRFQGAVCFQLLICTVFCGVLMVWITLLLTRKSKKNGINNKSNNNKLIADPFPFLLTLYLQVALHGSDLVIHKVTIIL